MLPEAVLAELIALTGPVLAGLIALLVLLLLLLLIKLVILELEARKVELEVLSACR